jgi:hypothetical protein
VPASRGLGDVIQSFFHSCHSLSLGHCFSEEFRGWTVSEGVTTLRVGLRDGNDGARAASLGMEMRPLGETMPEIDQPTKLNIVMKCSLVPR